MKKQILNSPNGSRKNLRLLALNGSNAPCFRLGKISISMKKVLSIIALLFVLTNQLNAQSKEKPPKQPISKPTKDQPTSVPDSIVSGFELKITTKEYISIQQILTYLLKTDLPVGQYIDLQTAMQNAKPVIISNPNKTKDK